MSEHKHVQETPVAELTDPTIDQREHEYYDRMAALWWDDQGPMWPLHRLNAFRVDFIRERVCEHFQIGSKIKRPLSGMDVLDIGCGGGILSESMARLGASVTGIDVVAKNIRVAGMHAESQGLSIDYRHCTVADLAGDLERWDLVLNMEVVEHVNRYQYFLAQSCGLVAENGLMLLATINRTIQSYLMAIVGAEYIMRWLPRGTHQWSKFRTPEELTSVVESESLRVIGSTGVRVNPFTRSFSYSGNLGVNYMMVVNRPRSAEIIHLSS